MYGTMKKIKLISSLVLGLSVVSSCKNFLDPYPSAIKSEEYILSSPTGMQGLIGECYEWISTNYNNNEGAYMDCLTDNAVRTSRTDSYARLAVGVTSPANDPFQTYWTRDYEGIYNTNLFLKDGNGRKLTYMLDERNDSLLTNLLWGEAYALRAWFEWDLLKKFGGKGTDGRMLGFPILTEPVQIWKMTEQERQNLQFKRNTYEECVKQIIADCDSAYRYLPIAHRNFLVENKNDLSILGSRNWGRMDGISTVAIKALVYLTWASPRFNPEGDIARWEMAARFAKQVMDFKETDINPETGEGFSRRAAVNFFDPNSPEIVFGSRYNASSDAMEKMFYPGSLQGNGTMGATQDLVDTFGMKDGYPIGESLGYAYDDQNPYLNRDPRFYSNIFYNGRNATVGSTNYTFECYKGGKDEADKSSSNSRTAYYIKKFVYPGVNWSESSVKKMPHSKFLIRWTHMVLAYAEAANHVAGPNGQLYGLTAKEAVSWLRSRSTYDGETGIQNDEYLEKMAIMGEETFDKFLRRERRVETCFEGDWFYDLRRWSINLGDLNKTLYRPSITKSGKNYTYDYTTEIENRVFRSAYLPLPYKEVLNNPTLIQNEGWESWQ